MVFRQPPVLPMMLALFLGACAGPGRSAPSETAAEAGPTDPAEQGEIAPRPFTAEQIAEAMPVGSWNRYRLEQPGHASSEQLSTVLSHQGSGMTLQTELFELDGSPRGEASTLTADWVELRDHATWPAEATVIRETRLELPAGTYDCWRYTVTSEENGQPIVSRYYFAESHPGAPIRFELLSDGVRVFRMTLVAFGGPSPDQ